MNGIVKRLVRDRNFGFIRDDITRMEYFFHKEDFEGRWEYLEEGNRVEFENVPSPKGPRASNVRLKQ